MECRARDGGRARGGGLSGHQPPAPMSALDTLAHPIPGLPVNVGPAERAVSAAVGAALVGVGLGQDSWLRPALVALGGALVARGATGYCPAFGALGHSSATANPVTLRVALTIQKPRDEVYAAWTDGATLPQAMEHLEAIEPLGDGRSRWTAKGPFGKGTLTWVSEETVHDEGRETAWRTVEGDVDHTGRVVFADGPNGEGTEVHVEWAYLAPPGTSAAAHLTSPGFERLLRNDLGRFRALLEAGEVPTTEGQPKGPWRPGRPVLAPTSPV